MSSTSGRSIFEGLLSELRGELTKLPEPSPPFAFTVGWADTFDHILRGDPTQKTGINDLISTAENSGRVILQAKGGGAKTEILRRLARQLCKRPSTLAIIIDLKRWSAPDNDRWKDLEDASQRIEYLFCHFATPNLDAVRIDNLSPDIGRIFLVDGLNEVSSSAAQGIVFAFDDYVRRAPHSSVIVADRVIRRDFLNPNRWRLATVMPLDTDQVLRLMREKLGSTRLYETASIAKKTLLTTPYFLDAALNKGEDASAPSAALSDYFARTVRLTPAELKSSAETAFRAYESNKSRTFPKGPFEESVGSSAFKKLTEAGALHTNGSAYFAHHLNHDFLVSVYLAADQARWTSSTFTNATLDKSSFDVIALALEQVPRGEADSFIRKVYDWDYYGAAYSVAESLHWGLELVSKEMEAVLLATLASRKSDLIKATGQRVTDALNVFPGERAKRFLDAADFDSVAKELLLIDSRKAWFIEWRELFTRTSAKGVTDEEMSRIAEPDSVIGWMLSNLLKRVKLTPEQEAALRSMLGLQPENVRWRIAHTLGAYPSKDNVEMLLRLLDTDPYRWTKYGAIRSLLEIAASAKQEEHRAGIFSSLRTRLPKISEDSRILEELERSILIDERRAPADWGNHALGLLEVLRNRESTPERAHHWEALAHRIRIDYPSRSVPNAAEIDEATLQRLASEAWLARENAVIFGATRVGCAVLADDNKVFPGCNVEHKYRSHDVHAEVNALTTMVAGGRRNALAVMIVAERERFTPCGACMDWIFQFGGERCIVAFQGTRNGPITSYLAKDLMPYYPK